MKWSSEGSFVGRTVQARYRKGSIYGTVVRQTTLHKPGELMRLRVESRRTRIVDGLPSVERYTIQISDIETMD